MLRTVLFVAKKRRLAGTLGERVKTLLAERGEGVKWLAGQIGLHRVSTSRLVNDKTPDPSLSLLRKVASALGVTVGELTDD